jgi:hypothetical protein
MAFKRLSSGDSEGFVSDKHQDQQVDRIDTIAERIQPLRKRADIATKVGLEWRSGKVWRNTSPSRIRLDVEAIAAGLAHGLEASTGE